MLIVTLNETFASPCLNYFFGSAELLSAQFQFCGSKHIRAYGLQLKGFGGRYGGHLLILFPIHTFIHRWYLCCAIKRVLRAERNHALWFGAGGGGVISLSANDNFFILVAQYVGFWKWILEEIHENWNRTQFFRDKLICRLHHLLLTLNYTSVYILKYHSFIIKSAALVFF